MVLLLEEIPFAYVVSASKHSEICSFCFKGASPMRRCAQCKFCHFCCAECQRKAWPDHRDECKAMARVPLWNFRTENITRLMARVIWKLNRGISKNEPNDRDFYDLMHHSSEIQRDPNRSMHFAQTLLSLKTLMGEENLPETSKLLQIFGRIVINCIGIYNTDTDILSSLGTGLYLNISKLDHSCWPNALIVWDGMKAMLNSLDPELKSFPGYSKLRISYVEIEKITAERQQLLRAGYYFDCNCDGCKNLALDGLKRSLLCPRCQNPAILIESQTSAVCTKCSNVISDPRPALQVMQICQWMIEERDRKDVQDRKRIYDEGCAKIATIGRIDLLLHPMNYFRFKIDMYHHIYGQYTSDVDRLQKLSAFGDRILDLHRNYYPKFHSEIGVHLYRIAQWAIALQNWKRAKKLLREAESIVSMAYGKLHPFYAEVTSMLNKCQQR